MRLDLRLRRRLSPTITTPLPGNVADADPRIISNLIVDMSPSNPAAIEAFLNNPLSIAYLEERYGVAEADAEAWLTDPVNLPLEAIMPTADHPQPVARHRPVAGLQRLDDFLRPVLRPWPRSGHQGRQRHRVRAAAGRRPAVSVGPDGVAGTGDELDPLTRHSWR